MQITFLTRTSALIYRRGLRQRVASLTLNCNGDFAIRAYGQWREDKRISCMWRIWGISVVTKMDRIMNERITGTTNMGEISKNVQESRMKYWEKKKNMRAREWCMVMEVSGKRRRGRPKRRWLDNIRNDLPVGTVRGGSAIPSSVEASHKKHRHHLKVGNDADVLVTQLCMRIH